MANATVTCRCCGSRQIQERTVLWKELTDQWRLAHHEIAYVDRQQGLHCADCGSNLRSMTLAHAVMACFGFRGLFQDFVRNDAMAGVRMGGGFRVVHGHGQGWRRR